MMISEIESALKGYQDVFEHLEEKSEKELNELAHLYLKELNDYNGKPRNEKNHSHTYILIGRLLSINNEWHKRIFRKVRE